MLSYSTDTLHTMDAEVWGGCRVHRLSPSCLCWCLFRVVRFCQPEVPLCTTPALQVPPERSDFVILFSVFHLVIEENLEEVMYLFFHEYHRNQNAF